MAPWLALLARIATPAELWVAIFCKTDVFSFLRFVSVCGCTLMSGRAANTMFHERGGRLKLVNPSVQFLILTLRPSSDLTVKRLRHQSHTTAVEE